MDHLKQIAAKLPEYGIDAMLLNSEPGEFYAVGFHGEGNVVVTPEKSFYFTDSRYIEAAHALIGGAEIAMTGHSRNYRAMVQEVIDQCGIKKLGFEEGYLSVAAYQSWEEGLTAQLVPAQALVDGLRAAKDQEELDRMRKAQEITDQAFDLICKFIQPGMTEQEIAARLQYEMLRLGAEKMSFDPIVASGPNGSKPHAVPSARKVQQGDFITMDFGCKYGGYCSDMTRTVALGEPTDEMKKVYAIVLEAQKAGIAATRAGVTGKSIDAAARKVIEKAGGLKKNAEMDQINRAEIVTDGQKIVIPAKGETIAASGGAAASGLININTADSTALQEIPGVGPATAEKIIAYRTENGRFASKEDIKNVSGIGEKTYEKMKDKITV